MRANEHLSAGAASEVRSPARVPGTSRAATSSTPAPGRAKTKSKAKALTAAGVEAGRASADAAPLTPALRVIPSRITLAPRRGSGHRSARLTWLFDGAGWPWLRVEADFVALLVAVLATSRLHPNDAIRMLPLVPVVLGIFSVRGMYRRRVSPRPLEGTMSVLSSTAVATGVVATGNIYLAGQPLPELAALHLWIFAVLSVVGLRAAVLGLRHLLRVLGVVSIPTLILGAGKVGDRVAERLCKRPGYGLAPVGFLDSDASRDFALGRRSELPVLGAPADLEDVVRRTGATHVVISFARERDHDLVPLIRRCTALEVDVSLVPRLFESINDRLTSESLGPLPLYVMRSTNPRSWQFVLKHVIDWTAAALSLLFLAPLLAGIALAVKLTSPGPMLFRQRRIGRDGKVFELLKFRSMRVTDGRAGEDPVVGLAPGGVEGDDRRTALGKLLRRSSLDELPQLWNVLRGEMSLVGPRPERPEFVERFGFEFERYDDRHRVRSGITGWAQVNGLRGKTELEDRIEWDNYYIENWSLALDFKILARTLVAVWREAE